MTDAAGNPLDFSQGRYLDLDTGIIVTNQKLMPSLLKAVRESLDEKNSSLWFSCCTGDPNPGFCLPKTTQIIPMSCSSITIKKLNDFYLYTGKCKIL